MRGFTGRRNASRPNIAAALATLAVIAILTVVVGLLMPSQGELSGSAIAADGDSLRLNGERIRLIDIDAVEFAQTCTGSDGREWQCGRAARAFLAGLVRDREVQCVRQGRDRYGRILAACAVEGTDIGEAVTRAGWALAALRYYGAQAEARQARRGIWSGEFVDPEVWRRTGGEPAFDLWAWLLSILGR